MSLLNTKDDYFCDDDPKLFPFLDEAVLSIVPSHWRILDFCRHKTKTEKATFRTGECGLPRTPYS